MRIYLSGPMTGIPENNAPAFNEAKVALLARGDEVTNPAELDADEDLSRDATDEEYAIYLDRDLALIPQHEAVVFIPGWEASGGAGREGREAIGHGLRLYTWLPSMPAVLWRLPEVDFLARSTTTRAPTRVAA